MKKVKEEKNFKKLCCQLIPIQFYWSLIIIIFQWKITIIYDTREKD